MLGLVFGDIISNLHKMHVVSHENLSISEGKQMALDHRAGKAASKWGLETHGAGAKSTGLGWSEKKFVWSEKNYACPEAI